MLILWHHHYWELLSQGKQDIRKVICAIHLMSIIKQYAAPNSFIFCFQSAVKPCGYTQNVKQIIFQQILFSLPLFSTRALPRILWYDSILLHNGELDVTNIFCCLKMKPVENILSHLQGQFWRFWRGNSLKNTLLHFVAFFQVASLLSIKVDNRKVGVDNEKALELDNRIFFSA